MRTKLVSTLSMLVAIAFLAGCAGKAPVDVASTKTETKAAKAVPSDWGFVQKLKTGTRVRVLMADASERYGRIMNTAPQFITLERMDRSERLKKNEVVRVDRHGIDAGKAFPLSMASFGIAVSAASSPTPESYDMSVGPGGSRQTEIKSSNINGYHVDAFRLVTGTITEILKAWNQSDEWVPVYASGP